MLGHSLRLPAPHRNAFALTAIVALTGDNPIPAVHEIIARH
jgi:hypothetical protein